MDAPPKISLDGLSKTFASRSGLVTALDNVSLNIAPGTFCVVVGPSGCGKTTLLRIVAGLEERTSGNFSIRRDDRSRPLNAMVFQGDSIFPWMNVWDNAAYGLKLRGVSAPQIREIVSHYLDRTGLRRFAEYYPHQLSGGMRQRVSIARAFANDPEVLFMDEPFSALDEQNKLLLQEELLRIWEEHKKTVIFITHSVDEAVTLGDKIVIMTASPGRIKAVVDVNLPRPRNILELRRDREFGELVFQIWGYLRTEVDAARAQVN
ncbi:ABC transporter ATP-binding protein [Bradyrhizobium sp. dw_78]|uniref:ABC transporter ATP-binding protein n=1 Tax=Bradyrhizobium sp. dw_78 TaxID=2719793 RepID=UPI001BD1F37F|nr:ABC transporter ATP-binding protein [Bradyrhizobium sp. dw_78]